MFFKKKDIERPTRRPAGAPRPTLSPRFARLVRESWWLLVVAAFVWLALILATYREDRSRLVVLRHRRADREPRRRRRRLARRSAALSVRRLRLVVGRRAASCWSSPAIAASGIPSSRRDHPLALGVLGFGLVLLSQRRARGAAPLQPAGDAAAGAGRRARRHPRAAACRGSLGFNGATLLLLALFAVGSSLFFGHVVAEADGAHRRRARERWSRWLRRRARGAPGPRARRAGAGGARGGRAGEARGRRARAGARRAAGRRRAEIRARREGEAAAALRRHAGFAAAAARAARRRAAGAGNGERRDARIHVAADRAQARRLRRRGAGAGRLSRAR